MKLLTPLLMLQLFLAGNAFPTALAGEGQAAPTVAAKTGESAQPATQVWPQDGSDLKVDPTAKFGRLKNGVRYVIYPTKEAPGRASVWLHMQVGSVMEEDDQQGMAHFLEHLAFNGTKHFPAGETLEYFQRLGLSFGAHTNAETSFDYTNYKLELPKANETLTGDALKLLRDFLDGMLLDEKVIDKERGVILSERLARNSADYRAGIATIAYLLEGTLFAKRIPIGQIDTVKKMPRQRFVDFYEKWYTPGRATVIAVGDFDVKMVEGLIEKYFADAASKHGEAQAPALGKITEQAQATAKSHADPDAQRTIVNISVLQPAAPQRDSFALQREEVVGLLGDLMMNRRLEKISHAPDAPILMGHAGMERMFDVAKDFNIAAACAPQKWETAIAVLEQEVRRAAQFGFTAAEFEQAKVELSKELKAQAAQAPTRKAADLAAQIAKSLTENRVYTHPDEDVVIVAKILSELNKEEVEKAYRAAWDKKPIRIMIQGNLKTEGDATKAILAAYSASQAKPVEAAAGKAAKAFAYTEFGPAGKVRDTKVQEGLDITSVVLANNVRVNIKKTNYEKDVVHVVIRVGGGLLELPADKLGLNQFATRTFIMGGLKEMTLAEINEALASKVASVKFAVAEDAFQIGGQCATGDLETELQLCTAYLTAPGYRLEAQQHLRDGLDTIYSQIEHTAEGAAMVTIPVFLRDNDRRFGFPQREKMAKFTMDELREWLTPALQKGYLEVGIVGDVDPEKALPLIAKTLGALPERAAVKPDYSSQKKLKFPWELRHKEVDFVSDVPRAMVCVAWDMSAQRNIKNDRRLSILGDILEDRLRLKIRQEIGATYTPQVMTSKSEAFADFGYLAAVMMLETTRMDEVSKLTAKIGEELSVAGAITDDEFDRAMKPMIASLTDLDNEYWMDVVGDCQERPQYLEAARNREQDFKSITKEEIAKLAQAAFAPGKAVILTVAPAKKAEPKPESR